MAAPALLSIDEAVARLRAEGLRLSATTLRRAINDREFPGVRLGKSFAIPVAQVEVWLRGEWRPEPVAAETEPRTDKRKRRPLRLVRSA